MLFFVIKSIFICNFVNSLFEKVNLSLLKLNYIVFCKIE